MQGHAYRPADWGGGGGVATNLLFLHVKHNLCIHADRTAYSRQCGKLYHPRTVRHEAGILLHFLNMATGAKGLHRAFTFPLYSTVLYIFCSCFQPALYLLYGIVEVLVAAIFPLICKSQLPCMCTVGQICNPDLVARLCSRRVF